jgi:hypothetical protein
VWEYDQALLWQSPCFEATVTHHTRQPVTLLLAKLAGARTLSSLHDAPLMMIILSPHTIVDLLDQLT